MTSSYISSIIVPGDSSQRNLADTSVRVDIQADPNMPICVSDTSTDQSDMTFGIFDAPKQDESELMATSFATITKNNTRLVLG